MKLATTKLMTRSGAVRASTVFAAIVAIVAGLVGAFLFKKFVLDKPNTAAAQSPVQPKVMREITVSAYNIVRCPIQPSHYKKLKVTDEEYQAIVKKFQPLHPGSPMLIGDQPLHRVPKVPIHTEEPIFEDQLEPLEFPLTIGERLRPGYRAAIVEVPAERAMVQVGDQVDVLATLQHDAFGPGGAATAILASGRCIARWGTIYPVCCPADKKAPTRQYTIEVTPCEFGLLELAKNMGASFALSVTHRPENPDGPEVEGAAPAGFVKPDGMDQNCSTVTVKDLERVFNIPARQEEKEKAAPPVGGIEVMYGNKYMEPFLYTKGEDEGTFRPAPRNSDKAAPAAPITPASGMRPMKGK